MQEHAMAQLHAPVGTKTENKRMECYPFVRLFRKCKSGNQEFNVETTALEGRYAWSMSESGKRAEEKMAILSTKEEDVQGSVQEEGNWKNWVSSFWSGR